MPVIRKNYLPLPVWRSSETEFLQKNCFRSFTLIFYLPVWLLILFLLFISRFQHQSRTGTVGLLNNNSSRRHWADPAPRPPVSMSHLNSRRPSDRRPTPTIWPTTTRLRWAACWAAVWTPCSAVSRASCPPGLPVITAAASADNSHPRQTCCSITLASRTTPRCTIIPCCCLPSTNSRQPSAMGCRMGSATKTGR